MTFQGIREWVHSCKNGFIKPGATLKEYQKGAMTAGTYPLTKLAKLRVVYGWNPKGKIAFATFQFNPSYLCQKAFTEMHAQFQMMFDWGYEEFYNTAVIKHVEIALDVHGVQKESCIVLARNVKTHRDHFESKGTTYLGGKHSNWKLCAYDKRKELLDKGKPAPQGPWTRIEATLQNTELPLRDLSSSHSSLGQVVVLDTERLKAADGGAALNDFRQRVFLHGTHSQLAYSLASAKDELIEQLAPASPDWYQPASISKQIREAATLIHPDVVHLVACTSQFGTPDLVELGHLSPLVAA